METRGRRRGRETTKLAFSFFDLPLFPLAARVSRRQRRPSYSTAERQLFNRERAEKNRKEREEVKAGGLESQTHTATVRQIQSVCAAAGMRIHQSVWTERETEGQRDRGKGRDRKTETERETKGSTSIRFLFSSLSAPLLSRLTLQTDRVGLCASGAACLHCRVLCLCTVLAEADEKDP